ncbi:uroporphyrinogen-III synthase [Metabacillus sp. 84]|uniref:uroporphyrinogen-III synthase n=1 Tax=Metabacillus sp. 84 TaxID=3404705 RepID=UPI003CF28152
MNRKKPLSGKHILITREKSQAASFARLIEELGAVPYVIPLVAIEPAADEADIESRMEKLHQYDWIIFTSANGVRFFTCFMEKFRLSFPEHCKTGAVGKKTAESLEQAGLKADLMPHTFSGEGLAQALAGEVSAGDSILVIRGSLSKQAVYKKMKEMGVQASELILYSNSPLKRAQQELAELLQEGILDFATFTSPSIVRSYMQAAQRQPGASPAFVCIGDVTAETVKNYGYDCLIADPYTIEGMVKKMIDHIEAPKEE